MGLFGLPSLTDFYPLLNIGTSIAAIPFLMQAEEKANAANRQQAESAANIIGGMGGFPASITEMGTPQFQIDTPGAIRNTYAGMLGNTQALFPAQWENLNQYAENLRGMMGDEQNRLLSAYEAREKGIGDAYDEYATDVMGRAQQRQDTGMAMLEGMGTQAKKDIDASYAASGNRQLMDLASRGFGSGSLRTGAMRGNERERQDAQGRLDESLRQQKLNTYTGLSGDVMNTAANVGTGRVGLLGDLAANAMNFLGNQSNQRIGMNSDIYGQVYGLGDAQASAGTTNQNAMLGSLLDSYTTGTANALDLTTGINNAQPSTDAFTLLTALGSGYGGAHNATIQENMLNRQMAMMQRQSNMSLPMAMFGPGLGGVGSGLMSPLGSMAGAAGNYMTPSWAQGY